MRVGLLEVDVVRGGTFWQDGGTLFGALPRVEWARLVRPDRANRVPLALNCLLVRGPDFVLLVDTGFGTRGTRPKTLRGPRGGIAGTLRDLGVLPQAVDVVVNTHLHHDHAGGNTVLGHIDRTLAAFPRARYLVQRREWETAMHPDELHEQLYDSEDFLPLRHGRLELLEGEATPAPGVRCVPAPGHTPGHQYVIVEAVNGDRPIFFLGDVAPLLAHVEVPTRLSAIDRDQRTALRTKRHVLREAVDRDALVVLSHEFRVGRVRLCGDGFRFDVCAPETVAW